MKYENQYLLSRYIPGLTLQVNSDILKGFGSAYMGNDVKVYVIIVTYNAVAWIDKCFNSLRHSTVPVYTVVIDNASKDDTVEYLKKNFPEAHVIANSKNRGFGQANNQGIEYAYDHGATHFFLLNQDTWIHNDTVGKLVEVQDSFDLAVVSPIHLSGKKKCMDYGYFAATVIQENNLSFVSDLMLETLKSYYKVSYINAAAWMISRRCIETIGGFDPLFFHYGEDRNYCQRIKYHNEDIAFVPESYIHHDRDYHGNEEVYNKRKTLTKLLSTYSDVNQPFIHPCLYRTKMHANFIVHSVKALLKMNFAGWLNIVEGYASFIVLFPQIFRSRKHNSKMGSNWLDIQS